MNKLSWEGDLTEGDLWKLFSSDPAEASDTILFYSQIKPLLAKLKLQDETRFYHVFAHSTVPERPECARLRATVTQRNLRKVAAAFAAENDDAAIQYHGRGVAHRNR
ncbi:MAG: hypothetical protein LCH92_12445 [Proteobacteria bacterium]|nr:hypothetical protein [Pseudomonadota bacterium]